MRERKAYARAYYVRNREVIRIKHKAWRDRNPNYFKNYYLINREKSLTKAKAQQLQLTDEQKMEKYERYRDKWSVKERTRSRKRSLKQHYGLTPERFANLLTLQGSVCACCGSDDPGWQHGWHVDHDHETGRVRAILCRPCNHTIGHAKENIQRLRDCADYLERYRNVVYEERLLRQGEAWEYA